MACHGRGETEEGEYVSICMCHTGVPRSFTTKKLGIRRRLTITGNISGRGDFRRPLVEKMTQAASDVTFGPGDITQRTWKVKRQSPVQGKTWWCRGNGACGHNAGTTAPWRSVVSSPE